MQEAYADFLERYVVEGGVDPAIVRSTLHQMGFGDDAIASMMGDSETYFLPFSTTTSTTSSSSSAASSLRRGWREASRFSTASSVVSASVEVAQNAESPPTAALVDEPTDTACSGATAIAHQAGAPVASEIPQKGGFRGSEGPTSLRCSSSSAAALAPVPSPFSSDLTTSTEEEAAGLVAHGADPTDRTPSPSLPRSKSSFCGMDTEESSAETSASEPSSSAHWQREPSSAPLMGSASPNPTECEVLAQWRSEYNALMLSSALPRWSSLERNIDTLPTKPLPAAEPREGDAHTADVGHSFTSGDRSKQGSHRGQSTLKLECKRGEALALEGEHTSDSDASTSSRDGATPSTMSILERTDAQPFPLCGGAKHHGAATPLDKGEEELRGFSAGHHRFQRHSPVGFQHSYVSPIPLAAPSQPCRYAVAKAKSQTLVLTCGVRNSCTASGCPRCHHDAAQCRHPYREAQDVRILRAPHVTKGGRHNLPPTTDAVSRCLDRMLDSARQRQFAARAVATGAPRVPIMHERVRTTVYPRAGMANDRQSSTLPTRAKIDRVQLARYYQNGWDKQERHTNRVARDAAWNTRCALLCCLEENTG